MITALLTTLGILCGILLFVIAVIVGLIEIFRALIKAIKK